MKYSKIDDLTLGQYQELYTIHTSTDDDLDKAIASVAVLTGKTRWEVEEMPLPQFKQMAKEISILFLNPKTSDKTVRRVKVNGKKYAVILDARKLSSGQYIDLQHFLGKKPDGTQMNMIDNMHKIMASLLVPIKFGMRGKYNGANHEAIAEGVQSLKFMDVQSTCVFFSKLWNRLIENIRGSALKEYRKMIRKSKDPFPVQMTETDLLNIMDGFTMPSR